MAEAKLAPNLPQWMVDHANRYISSGGKEGHIYTVTPPGYSEMHVPSLLLTTTGRKSGEKYIFPLFYGEDGKNYIIVASKGGAPQHPNWYRNLVANPEVEVQVGQTSRRRREQLPAPTANACGKRHSSSGHHMRIMQRRPSARSLCPFGACRVGITPSTAATTWPSQAPHVEASRRVIGQRRSLGSSRSNCRQGTAYWSW
jgi:deazaflavin-dependent oxidoreductase (nitroreductase family)